MNSTFTSVLEIKGSEVILTVSTKISWWRSLTNRLRKRFLSKNLRQADNNLISLETGNIDALNDSVACNQPWLTGYFNIVEHVSDTSFLSQRYSKGRIERVLITVVLHRSLARIQDQIGTSLTEHTPTTITTTKNTGYFFIMEVRGQQHHRPSLGSDKLYRHNCGHKATVKVSYRTQA